ncbi:hypothetical protein GOARA_027_00490 [Gordonia araii NBRC 100433]|uniref:TY-Chap C-terminal domain-containing protein n=1 Tax=Gordonia araii NBRC 100433 TaxID=1073574 RepID=G7GZR1_9ACTN|nr:hypothetical protein [Gordonia araii]NNG98852.1 hypothetical protein [Gordonia araii NBRC 100433]GAB09086.1 hypothetical protein GOARA_027_00490 [Gordonia araii NBRC 100433]
MGVSDELERLVTLSRRHIEQVCADETQIPEFIELCREKFDEHLVDYEENLDEDDVEAQHHWQEAVAWRETAAILTTMVSRTAAHRRSA